MSDPAHASPALHESGPAGPILALVGFAIYATHDVVVKYLGASYSVFQIMFFSGLLSFPLIIVMLMRDRTPGTLQAVHLGWSLLRMATVVLGTAAAFYA
ncbi:MAG: hypothetical protein KJZ59_13070, partial [Pararhodobacter sp.]|nr:hypothetical protein [Pararhodobacter sp.]